MGGAVSAGRDNDDLIDNLMQAHYIRTPEVERVFRAVDRATYYLPDFRKNAYKDLAWKNGNIHISAPCIYSAVMENLNLTPGLSFLNVGSGTGYLSTMVGLMLGPFGTNHGIEMHADVIQYAYEKLSEFKKNSPALDCFEFCDPVFVNGNALCLPSDIRQYDRVYCGAACPEGQENYLKNLIKVGGVLVMPHNDLLLQITRTSQTEWEEKSVLPVSFSGLMLPGKTDSKAPITMPSTEPVALQAMCRSCIRRTLRSNAEREHPELTKRRKRVYPRKKRGGLRSFMIPFLDSSDEESNSTPRHALVVNSLDRIGVVLNMRHRIRNNPGASGITFRRLPIPLRPEGSMALFATCGPINPDQREPNANAESTTEDQESLSAPQPPVAIEIPLRPFQEEIESSETPETSSRRNLPKREKLDSGVGIDVDNNKDVTTSDDDNETNDTSLLCQTTSDEDMDVDSESDQAGSVDLRKSEDEGVEEDLVPKVKKICRMKREQAEPEYPSYTSVMKDKIQLLPLPPVLKAYVNLDREF